MLGTTCEECEVHLGMSHQTVSARRTDLRRLGLTDYLHDDEGHRVRRPTSSGRSAFVEIATDKGGNIIRYKWRINVRGDPTKSRHKGNPASTEAFESINQEACARRVLEFMVHHS